MDTDPHQLSGPLVPSRDALVDAVRQLWRWCIRLDDIDTAARLLRSVPYVIEDDAEISRLRTDTALMLSHLTSPQTYHDFYDAIWENVTPQTPEALEAYAGQNAFHANFVLQACELTQARTLLDCGSGNGWLPLWLARRGITATGLNLTRRAVDAAQTVALSTSSSASFQYADAETFMSDQRYDVVTALEILEHVRDPHALIVTMERHCRPGGRCVLTTPNGSTVIGSDVDYATLVGPKAHVRVYTRTRILAFMSPRDLTIEIGQGPGAGSLMVMWQIPEVVCS